MITNQTKYREPTIEELLQAARSPEARLLLVFALRMGARAGEQLAVQWGDIDIASLDAIAPSAARSKA